MTANTPVTPTANGKAVESVTSITPSNASPASMTSGTIYQPTANGVTVESVTSKTPDNFPPPVVNVDTIFRVTKKGYIIESYQLIEPTNNGTPFSSAARTATLMETDGYAYDKQQPNFMSPDKTQVISSSTGGTTNISVTQKPRYIVMATWNAAGSQYGGMLGVVDVTNSTAKRLGYSSSGSISWSDWSGYTSYFTSITSSTVTYKSNWSTTSACRSMILIYY